MLEAEFHYWAFHAECPVGKAQMGQAFLRIL
jgi:hypothetical protein